MDAKAKSQGTATQKAQVASILMESPVYVVVERIRKSKAAYATGFDVGDKIRFRSIVKNNSSRSTHSSLYQTYYDMYLVEDDGTEELLTSVSPVDISKAFTFTYTPETAPAWMSKPIFRIAVPEVAAALEAGCSLEDVYAI